MTAETSCASNGVGAQELAARAVSGYEHACRMETLAGDLNIALVLVALIRDGELTIRSAPEVTPGREHRRLKAAHVTGADASRILFVSLTL
jgi:hypothetical protein